jgi:predicted DsbA family dithiol-disulfide isomerase
LEALWGPSKVPGGEMVPPRITVWSDYICPFCYVAVERAEWLERRFGAQVEWRPFDLHPEYPPEGIARERLDARYGGERWRAQLDAMFDAAGLPSRRAIERVPNSRKALRLAEHARDRGLHAPLHRRLFDAYWHRGLDIGDDRVLVDEATSVGLDEAEVRELLAGDRHLDRVHGETERAVSIGASGVPAWLVDERLLIAGAQPHELFGRVLSRIGHGPSYVERSTSS